MLWTLIGFIVLLGALLVHFLQKVVKALNKYYVVNPSDAVIDQSLPEEIFEHVMTFMDPLALMECRFVSKYWHYHATKSRVEKHVMDAYELAMKSVPMPALEIPPAKISKLTKSNNIWMNDPTYPKNWLLRDRALACQYDKQLLEIDAEYLHAVANSLRPEAHKYIVKVQAVKNGAVEGVYIATAREYYELYFKKESIPGLNWDAIGIYSAVDMMFDLEDFLKHLKKRYQPQKVYSIRERRPVPHFGFMPLNKDLMLALIVIFAPLIVHDILHSAFLPAIKLWFGPLIFVLTCVANLILANAFTNGRGLSQPIFIGSLVVFSIAYLLACGLAYPVSMDYFAMLGMCALALTYLISTAAYTSPRNLKPTLRRAMPALIGLTAVLLHNDWSVLVDSIRSGVVWRRLFDNTVFYAWFCLYMIALNFLSHVGSSNRLQWRYLVEWEKLIARNVMLCYGFVVFMTLYGPTWSGNHL